MMALPAATALIVLVAAKWLESPKIWLHVPAVLLILNGFGAAIPLAIQLVPREKTSAAMKRVNVANRSCPSLRALAPIQHQPRGIIFTFIDLGPRIIVATHHDAIGGPYHRNDRAIADVMEAFRGDAAQAQRIVGENGSN
jgi:hypothetical protein